MLPSARFVLSAVGLAVLAAAPLLSQAATGNAQTVVNLKPAVSGATYTYTIPTTGGLPPVAFKVTAGKLPAGLELDGSTGTISGTPSDAAASSSPYKFTVGVSDASSPQQTHSQAYALSVNARKLDIPLPPATGIGAGNPTGGAPTETASTQGNPTIDCGSGEVAAGGSVGCTISDAAPEWKLSVDPLAAVDLPLPTVVGGKFTLKLKATAVGAVTVKASAQSTSAQVKLTVESVTCTPATVAAGEPVTCTFTVPVAYSGSPTVTLTGAGTGVMSYSGTVAVKGGSGSVTIYAPVPPPNSPPTGASFDFAVTDVNLPQDMKFTLTVTPSGVYGGGEIMRLVGGSTASFAPNTAPAGKLFLDMFLEWSPFCGDCSKAGEDDNFHFGGRTRWWLQAGVLSTSQAASAANVAALGASAAGGSGTLTGINWNSAESFSLRTGLSTRLWNTGAFVGGIPHGNSRTAVELIGGVGFTTPIASSEGSAGVYCVPAAATSTCPALTGASAPSSGAYHYDVVTVPARTSFYSNWGAGIRFQTFYDSGTDSKQPAVTDVTFGQDQAVTSGRLGRAVVHFEGFWPVPKADFIFIVFGGSMRYPGQNIGFETPPCTLTRSVSAQQLVSTCNLAPVSTTGYTGPLSGPMFTQLYLPQYPADSFRVGVALDIVDLLKNHLKFSEGGSAQ